MLLAIILTVLVGLCLGVLGSGGSMLLVPILVYAAHVPVHEAIATSLVVIASTSLLGWFLNLRNGTVDLRVGAPFAVSGMAGAWLGARFTHLVPARFLLISFCSLMIFIGSRLLTRPAAPDKTLRRRPIDSLLLGAAVGVVTGFLGVGGGFVIVPALVLAGGLEMKIAIGTSLGVIALNGFAGFAGQLAYIRIQFPLALTLVVAGSAGMLAGVWAVSRLGAPSLQRALALSIIVLGGCILLKNLLSYA